MKHMLRSHFRLLILLIAVVVVLPVLFFLSQNLTHSEPLALSPDKKFWKEKLTNQQYYVLHENGTDIPFTSPDLLYEKRKGTYVTADCEEPVFRSEQKFDSGTGWPSFWAPINEKALLLVPDSSEGMTRIEVRGKKCNTHLGHVFDDGPDILPDGRKATGKRYCINASALKFIPDENQ